MATDYETFYRENRHGLGEPTKEFVAFFDAYEPEGSSVLDVGCGQGRDALYIARRGHSVTAIDLSPSGVRDLQTDAAGEGSDITAEVADIRDYKAKSKFDIILIDRTLHMLASDERKSVLRNLEALSKHGSHILIADDQPNIPAFKTALKASGWTWTPTLERCGFLFAQRE